MLVDTHAHLDFVEDLRGTIERAKDAGVKKIICIGTSIDASKKCVEIAQKHSSSEIEIYATCGIHPEDGKGDIEKYGENCIHELEKIVKSSDKVVGIGECGLDYYLTAGGKQMTTDEEKKGQIDLFKAQVEVASELNLPIVVHCRNAWGEIFDLLKVDGLQSKLRGVFHSWTGDLEAYKRAASSGFYVSFSGILTFKNAPKIVEVAKNADLERIVLETDSPFLSPEPLRGRKNEPKNVRIVAEFLADLRDLPLEKIEDITSKNAKRLFKFN